MSRIAMFLVTVGLLSGVAAQNVAAKPLDERVSLTGQFHVIWGDRSLDNTDGPRETARFGLIDKAGKWTELDMTEMDGGFNVLSLNRQHVALEGQWQSQKLSPSASGNEDAPNATVFRVTSIRRDAEKESFAPQSSSADAMLPMAAAVTGAQPWLTILCRFSDAIGETPLERGWFDELMLGNSYPSMSHYWQEQSFGQVNLAGSKVVGWYNLPRPRSYYMYDANGDGQADLDFGRTLEDCTAAADAEVYFPNFAGINLVFNQHLNAAYGGSWMLSLDGKQKTYGITWVGSTEGTGQSIWGHEMGHALGLMHSSGPYANVYDSVWDVMSGLFWGCVISSDPVFHCIGQHTIGWHKELLGWIPSARIYTAGSGSNQTIEIKRLESSGDGTGYQLAKIPINGSSTDFYTVEARQRMGYDNVLPGDAVIIHHVDTGRWDRTAQVVDPDGNGNPNDAGAMWVVGDVFTAGNGIKVSVVGTTADGFTVVVENGGFAPPPPPPPTQFALTVGKSGNGLVTAPGIDCGSDCQEQYQDGSVVTLSASPDSGWTFSGWSGDADCADGQVTMSRDMTCHAEFFQEPRPNLSGWFTSLSKKVKKGRENMSFSLVAQNNGARTVYSQFTVAFYVSDDAVWDASDTYLTANEVKVKKNLMPVGGTATAKVKKIMLPFSGIGKYLIAVIDSGNAIPESDEHDNIVVVPIP